MGKARKLGTTIASLGDVAQGGVWLKTPLVTRAGPGRVVFLATGKAVRADLIPIKGPATGGSRASRALFDALGVALTALPKLVIYAR